MIYIFEYKTLHIPKRSNILTSPPFAPPQTVIFCRFFACWGKTKNPDFAWKLGFYYLLLFFKVVPPGIEPFALVYSNTLSDCTFIALFFMKAIELASHLIHRFS